MSDRTQQDALCRRNSLRQQLWANDKFAHSWLCHSKNDAGCPDGCDAAPDTTRARFYATDLEPQ